MQVHYKFNFFQETLFLTVSLIDRFLEVRKTLYNYTDTHFYIFYYIYIYIYIYIVYIYI